MKHKTKIQEIEKAVNKPIYHFLRTEHIKNGKSPYVISRELSSEYDFKTSSTPIYNYLKEMGMLQKNRITKIQKLEAILKKPAKDFFYQECTKKSKSHCTVSRELPSEYNFEISSTTIANYLKNKPLLRSKK